MTNPDASGSPLMPVERPGRTLLEEAGVDYLHIVVPRDEIATGNIGPTLAVLTPLIESRQTARLFMERVAISFDGFNDTTAELFEIPEVRDYVQELDARFPYWLYFLDKSASSLDAIWRCFMPPHLTPQAQVEHFPVHLDPLLRNWWGPAMGAICEFIDASEGEHSDLTDRYVLYFQGKRGY